MEGTWGSRGIRMVRELGKARTEVSKPQRTAEDAKLQGDELRDG